MKEFPLPLVIRALLPDELAARGLDHQYYELTAPFAYISTKYGRVDVPVGFLTDFASVPRIVWNLLAPDDPQILAPSVSHDWNYTEQLFEREQADEMIEEGMAACGASWWKRAAVFRALRAFGGGHWVKKAAADPANKS